jgi:hypothetical protein
VGNNLRNQLIFSGLGSSTLVIVGAGDCDFLSEESVIFLTIGKLLVSLILLAKLSI